MDAASCAAAIEASDLRGCQVWVFQPDRTYQVSGYDSKVDFFKASYTEVVDIEVNGIQYKGVRSRDYGLGEWVFISQEDLDECWGEDGAMMPRCRGDGGVENEEVDQRDRKRPMIKKQEYQKRNNERKTTTAQKKSDSIKEKDSKLVTNQKDAGLFPCERTDGGRRCTKVYSTKLGLHNHNFEVGTHTPRDQKHCHFPTLCLQDRVVIISSDVEKCLDLESRARVHVNAGQTFQAVPKDQIHNSVPGFDHIFTSNELGQYRKDNINIAKTRVKYTPAQSEYLQRQYNIGVETPEQRQPLSVVQEAMRTVRVKDSGRFVFNRREHNPHGHVLDVGRMKIRFSQCKKSQGKNYIHPREAFWRAYSVGELRRRVGGDTTNIKKAALAKTMAERDKANVTGGKYIVGFVDGSYIGTPEM